MTWWRDAVVYQIYVRSFADGDGDGIGDLAGLRARLPYLRDLGVDALWCNPWYPSPLLDGGYDVADYRDIDPRLGTLEEVELLIEEAHGLGLRVLGDLVPNHTSWDHAWFRAALAAGPGSPERARYHFHDGRGPDGAEPPNNWQAVFGGPAWQRVSDLPADQRPEGVDDGQWYLHLFDISQPDLNWTNPEVRAEFRDVLRFWFDRGIDGFRVDVTHALTKHPDLRDVTQDDYEDQPGGNHPHWDRDDVHDIIREWRAVADGYEGGRLLVAEAWVDHARLQRYVRPDEYHQAFDFTFLRDGWQGHLHREHIPAALDRAAAVGATPTWVFANHDVVRPATRFALPPEVDEKLWLLDGDRDLLDAERGERRARAAALLLLALPEATELPTDVLQDPVWERTNHMVKGRDGCRVPMPWDADAPALGFGSGEDPWLPQPPSFARLAVSEQAGVAGSTLELHRAALRLRREHGTQDETARFLDLGSQVVAFERGSGLRCVVNMGSDPVDLPAGELLLASGPSPVDGQLLPDDAVWLLAD